MAKLNLSVKHTFLRKLKRYRKQLLIAAPIVVSIVFAFYAQTYFQQQQDLKSRAGEHETSITVSNKYLDIIIKNDGTLQSFYDKRNGRELIGQQYKLFNYSYRVGTDSALKVGRINTITKQSQENKLILTDTQNQVTFNLSFQSHSEYFTFTINQVAKPADIKVINFTFQFKTPLLICSKGGIDCASDKLSLIAFCLSPNCSNRNSHISNQYISFGAKEIGNLPLAESKLLLITSPYKTNSIETQNLIEKVKTSLGINRIKSFEPTLFLAGGSLSIPDNVTKIATKAKAFGFKRILLGSSLWQKTKGLWDINTNRFPPTVATDPNSGLKAVIDSFHKQGLKVGIHILPAGITVGNELLPNLSNLKDVAKDINGKPIHPRQFDGTMMSNIYLINSADTSLTTRLADNVANNFNSLGIDFAYLDGMEWFNISVDPRSEFYGNRFLKLIADRTNIDLQTSIYTAFYPLYVDKLAMSDVFKLRNIKNWVDNQGFKYMLRRHDQSQIPNFGWIDICDKLTNPESSCNPDDYAYALDAAIANGAPLTVEISAKEFLDPSLDKYKNVFSERLNKYNRLFSASSVLETEIGQYRLTQFNNKGLGIELFNNILDDSSPTKTTARFKPDTNTGGKIVTSGCKSGNCVYFGGTTVDPRDYIKDALNLIDVPAMEKLNINSALTIETWVKISDLTKDFYLFKNGPGPNLFFNANYGKIAGFVLNLSFLSTKYQTGNVYETEKLNQNQWYHIAYSYDAASQIAKIYLDGELSLTKNFDNLYSPGYIPLTDFPWQIGDHAFNGFFDNTKIYNRILTDDEISTDYKNPEKADTDGMIAFWKFDKVENTPKVSIPVKNNQNIWIHSQDGVSANTTLVFSGLSKNTSYKTYKNDKSYSQMTTDQNGAGQINLTVDNKISDYALISIKLNSPSPTTTKATTTTLTSRVCGSNLYETNTCANVACTANPDPSSKCEKDTASGKYHCCVNASNYGKDVNCNSCSDTFKFYRQKWTSTQSCFDTWATKDPPNMTGKNPFFVQDCSCTYGGTNYTLAGRTLDDPRGYYKCVNSACTKVGANACGNNQNGSVLKQK